MATLSLLITTGCASDKPTITPTQVPTATPAPNVPRDEIVQYLKGFNEVQNSLLEQASEIKGPDNETLRNDSDALYNLVSKYFELASDSVTRLSELEPPAKDDNAVRHWKLSVGYYSDGRDLYDGLMRAIKADDAERIKTVLGKLQDDSIHALLINQTTEALMETYRIPDFEVDYRQRGQQ
jgi:hypothetical protein